MKKLFRKISMLFKRVFMIMRTPEMMLLPGQLAFFLVLAVIPTITLISYFASVLNLSMDFIYNFLVKAFSKDIAEVLLSTSGSFGGIGLILVIIFGYYISSNGASSIIVSSDTIYGIKPKNWLLRRGKSLLMIFLFNLTVLVLLLVPIFGNAIIAKITQVNLNANVTNMIVTVFNYLQSPFLWVVLFFIVKAIYIMAPDKKISSKSVNLGSFFTTVSWIILTYGYSYYLNNIANYEPLYGKFTTLCVLMIWFYFLAYLFVIGLGLNYQKEMDTVEL